MPFTFPCRPLGLALALLLCLPVVGRGGENDASAQIFPLDAQGVVTVRATSGVIRVGIWDRDEVRVEVIKRAIGKELLDLLRVDVESGYSAFSVVTEIPQGTGALGEILEAGTIDLGLTIPRRARLQLSATTANVRIEGVRGDTKAATTTGSLTTLDLTGAVDLTSTHGPLQASFAAIHEDQRINLTSEHGSIRLLVPQSLSAFLKARSGRGLLKSDLPISIEDGPEGDRRIDGALNTGGAHIRCETENGGILILKRQ